MIASQEMKTPLAVRGSLAVRITDTLKTDLHQFMAEGGNHKRAKFFHNVIQPYIFDIPLDQVNNPGITVKCSSHIYAGPLLYINLGVRTSLTY